MLISHLEDKFPDFKTTSPPIGDLQAFYKVMCGNGSYILSFHVGIIPIRSLFNITWKQYTWLLLNHCMKEKLGNFMFNQGIHGGKERFFKESGEISEVLSFVLLYFRAVIFSIVNCTSSGVWQSLTLFISFCSVQSV